MLVFFLKKSYFDHPVTWVTHWDIYCVRVFSKYCLTVLVYSTVNTNMFEGFQSVQSNLCAFCLMCYFLLSHSTSMTAFECPKWARVIKLLTEAFACKSIHVDFLPKCIRDVQELRSELSKSSHSSVTRAFIISGYCLWLRKVTRSPWFLSPALQEEEERGRGRLIQCTERPRVILKDKKVVGHRAPPASATIRWSVI